MEPKILDYDLDSDEREEKYKNHDLILCENCNENFENQYPYHCKNCYKKETDKEERNRIKYGKCKECFQINTHHNWCKECNAKRFQQEFPNWTSGNEFIDSFIQETQLNALD